MILCVPILAAGLINEINFSPFSYRHPDTLLDTSDIKHNVFTFVYKAFFFEPVIFVFLAIVSVFAIL